MNKIAVLCTVILLALTITVYGQEKQEKKYALEFLWQKPLAAKKNKNIKDYFLLLPTDFFDCEGVRFFSDCCSYSTKKEREKLITKLDVKNDYLEFGTAQLVLFKDREKHKDIIAIQWGGCGAGNTCGALNTLMELKKSTWIFRVDLLPQMKNIDDLYYAGDVCPYFDLPQHGTTILVRNECLELSCKDGEVITRYFWDKGRFINGN